MRVLVVGSGTMAYFLARRFVGRNFEVAVATSDEAGAAALARDLRATILLGDGTSPLVLRDAGADRADILLALLPHDEDNLVACQVARRMFEVPRVVSLVNDPDNVELFHCLGITTTFSATELLAQVIEERTSTTEVMSLLPLARGRVHVSEVVLPEAAPAVGRYIRDLGIPSGALIATILRAADVVVPSGDTGLQAGDQLVLISRPDDHGRFLRLLLGDQA